MPNLDGVAVVVVTKDHNFSAADSHVEVVDSPKKALDFLITKHFKKALIAGGGEVNASFMEQKLVDEIYLDVEPIALGDGIKLFSGKAFELKLRLLGTKHLSENELQLHYQVIHKK